jgi:hypothetical protein
MAELYKGYAHHVPRHSLGCSRNSQIIDLQTSVGSRRRPSASTRTEMGRSKNVADGDGSEYKISSGANSTERSKRQGSIEKETRVDPTASTELYARTQSHARSNERSIEAEGIAEIGQ